MLLKEGNIYMKKFISLLTAAAIVLTLCFVLPVATSAHAESIIPQDFEFSGRIILLGDSTVCDYDDNYCLPYDRYGWGMKLAEQFDNVEVINFAVGGASTRNYHPLPQYQTFLKTIKAGDYLFIQFGHNDEAVTTDRGTYTKLDASTLDSTGKDSQGRYSYEYLLMKYYVTPAVQKGAYPVFVTPVTRLATDGQAMYSHHAPYQEAMKTLGRQYGIPVIDMTTKTAELYTELYAQGGAEATRALHCFIDPERTTIDQSHLSNKGATIIASMIAKETKTLGLDLGNYLHVDCTHAETYTQKENIVDSTYTTQGSYDLVVYCKNCNKELNRIKQTIPVKKPEPKHGDINGDGSIDIKDVTILKQYLAKWKVSINAENADVNGDGEINIKDLTLIKQFIAKWKVTLG